MDQAASVTVHMVVMHDHVALCPNMERMHDVTCMIH